MAGRGRGGVGALGLSGMAAATAVVSVAYGLGVGRYWVAVVAVIAAGLCFNWSSGKLDAGKLLTIGRWLGKHVFRALRARPKGAAGWGVLAGTRSDDPATKVDRRMVAAWREVVPKGSDIAVVEVGNVASLAGLGARPRLTVKQSASLAESAAAAGLAIEPDARVARPTYAWDQAVAVFEVTQGRGSGPPADARTAGAALIFRLGYYVAAADGAVDRREIDHLVTFLRDHFALGPDGARRIEAVRALLEPLPPTSLAGLGADLQTKVAAGDRELVGRVLVGVAAVDGSIGRREVGALRAAYRSLGLDPAGLEALLRDLQPPPGPHPDVEVPAEARAVPEARPSETPAVDAPSVGVVSIDPERLKRVLGETRDVARILGEAMKDGDRDDEPAPTPRPAPVPPPPAEGADRRFEGLAPRYRGAAGELLARPEWSRDDFDDLARRHTLMPSSLVEVVNDWAQDRLGDLLLEPTGDGDDAPLRVQGHLLDHPPTVPRP